MKRIEVCNKALEYLDTPFHHQGRIKGVDGGIDCAGLVVEVAKECQLFNNKVEDLIGYSRIPNGFELINTLKKGTAKEKNINELKIGDILLFNFTKFPQHLGIYMPDNKLIHSYSVIGKVVIHNFDTKWMNRVVNVYEYFNIED